MLSNGTDLMYDIPGNVDLGHRRESAVLQFVTVHRGPWEIVAGMERSIGISARWPIMPRKDWMERLAAADMSWMFVRRVPSALAWPVPAAPRPINPATRRASCWLH